MVSDRDPSVTMNVVVETEYNYASEQNVQDSIPKGLEGRLPKVAALEFKSYDAYRELVSNVKLAENGKGVCDMGRGRGGRSARNRLPRNHI